jgi:thiol-disulfide isomerase/thioredoxin
MNRFLLIIFALTFSCFLYSQTQSEQRVLKQANNFTITTTDGITRNLYNTLDSGKTVFIDLFYTTCYYCQLYAPVIEEIYQNTGAGQGDIEFWGISNNLFDTNNVIEQYKLDYNVTNPCAGPWGGGIQAFTILVNGQNFTGFPTYCIICPDRTLYFDPCYPPTPTGFDPFFESCDTLTGINYHNNVLKSGIISVYPNPASTELSVEITMKDPGPVNIEFYNLLGLRAFGVPHEIIPGKQNFNINIGHLPNGAYFIKMMQNGQFIDTKKAWIYR